MDLSRHSRALFAALGAAALLGACAGYSPAGLSTGAAIADVRQRMGPPTGEYKLSDGRTRLEFARGPLGMHTYMLDFDANGRLVSWEQVLTEKRFGTVHNGMTRDEVLMSIGHPSEQRRLSWQERALWSYRFEGRPFCRWFQVGIDDRGQVVDAGYGPDPACPDNFVTEPRIMER